MSDDEEIIMPDFRIRSNELSDELFNIIVLSNGSFFISNLLGYQYSDLSLQELIPTIF
jgi:hypothetical protein